MASLSQKEERPEFAGLNQPESPIAERSEPIDPNSIQIQTTPELEKTLVHIVLEDFDSAKRARMDRRYGSEAKGEELKFDKWIKEIRDLYSGEREAKVIPWRFCSNRSLRIATAVLDLLHARLYPSIVNEDLLKWRPGEVTDTPKVERIGKLMVWWMWIRSRMRSFFDNWTKVTIGYGESVSESSWNVDYIDTGETKVIPINGDDGQQLMNPDGTPAQEEFRDIRPIESTKSKIYMPDNVYFQKGSRDIQKDPVILEDEFFFREIEEGQIMGQFKNASILMEFLPFDKASVEGLPPEQALEIQKIKMRNKPVKIIKWYGNYDADGDGFAENIRICVSPEFNLYMGGVALKNVTKSGERPLDFTKYMSRFDHPEELWGEGVLEKVKELAQEVDAIFNQLSDSNTLSILRPGFYDPAGDVDAPVLNIAPNKMTPVSDPSRNIFFPNFEINIQRLLDAIRLVLEFIERLTAASAYVLGKESEVVGGSGTATRTQAIVQSAEQRFALPAEHLREGAARIVKQHLDLLQLNIPPGLETRVLGEKGEPIFSENELTQEGIAGEYDAYLLPDPSMGSAQSERDIAQLFYSVLLQNPIVGTDPAKIYRVTADVIKSYGKNPEDYLGPEPDWDMIDSPEDENTLIIQGDFARVKAQLAENHILHIQQHQALLQSPSLAQVPPALNEQIMMFTQQHMQEHMQMMQLMIQIQQKFGGGKSTVGGEDGTGGDGKKPNGAGESPGLGNLQGPLGEAMQTKGAGTVNPPQSPQA